MRLYEKLFGRILRAPADEENDDGSGQGEDRGDNFSPTGEDAGAGASKDEVEEGGDGDEAGDEADEGGDGDEAGEADGDAGGEEEEDPPRDDKGRFAKREELSVPKARFDEALAKERERAAALERQLAELKAAQDQVKKQEDTEKLEAEIKGLEQQHAKLLLEGDAEKAAEISSMIRAKERQVAVEQSRSMSAQAKEQAREEIRMELTVERLEGEYPALNPDHESYDEDLVELVLARQQSLITREKLTPSKALAKAATTVMARFGAPKVAAEVEDTEKKSLKTPVEDRKQQQVKKNVETAKKQPASMKESGLDTDKMGDKAVDIATMSYEEFEALPEATKAKLRGDFA